MSDKDFKKWIEVEIAVLGLSPSNLEESAEYHRWSTLIEVYEKLYGKKADEKLFSFIHQDKVMAELERKNESVSKYTRNK